MYVQGKYDGKVYVGCGPKNLSPKIQLNTLMISKTLVQIEIVNAISKKSFVLRANIMLGDVLWFGFTYL